MLVKVVYIDGLFRIVEEFTGKIALKRNGQPWDGGGHPNITTAIEQATAINSGDEIDYTMPIPEAGEKGESGERGESGHDGIGISFRGEWSTTESYSLNEITQYNDTLYIKISNEDDQLPPSASQYWKVFFKNKSGSVQGFFGGGRRELPSGGNTGQTLKKSSDSDYAVEWADDLNGGGGGSQTGLSSSGILASISSDEENVTGDGTSYTVGSSGCSESYDIGSDFSNGIFVAPDDASYACFAQFEIDNVQFKDRSAEIVVTGTYPRVVQMVPEDLDTFGETEEPAKIRYSFSGVFRVSSGGTIRFRTSVGAPGDGKVSNILSAGSVISVMQTGQFTEASNNTIDWIGL